MRNLNDSMLKWTYVTRGLPSDLVTSIGVPPATPRLGALVVARVVRVGVHDHAEDPAGRRMRLYRGDLLVGAFGNRYATDFYEGYVPQEMSTHLLTAGGLVGTVASSHDAHGEPTSLEVVGSLTDGTGRALSTEDFSTAPTLPARPPLATLLVVGSGMNAGKTTTVASIVRGLTAAGLRVGAGKVTGSGSGKDRWSYVDAGAYVVSDFLEFGMPSTFGYPLERLTDTMFGIRDRLVGAGAEVVVLEIADGVLQEETAHLLDQAQGEIDGVVFAAVDALSASAGVEALRARGLHVPALSGVVSRSPLASREAAAATGLPVLTPSALAGDAALSLLRGVEVAA